LGFIKKILQIDDRGDARFPLRGKLAVVTGASGAIGSEVARRLARDGASVIVHFNSNRDDAESVAKRMTKTGWGRIINMGSVFGESAPAAGLGIYCGTKFALRGLTRAWSRDLGPAGITVHDIQPALIQEEPYPTAGPVHNALERFVSVGRFGKPADIAEAVAFLANPKAGYINGESLTVDGGWSA
jgi:3-oxoacyl-[acyl-carrier protein] reductase